MRKPRLFIASSAESLNIAEAVNVNLDHDFEVTIWKNGTFRLSSNTIDDLILKSSSVDFALFIFSLDDIVTIREKTEHVVRDNVLFELGLYVGAIGKERSFILKPRNVELHLPTDLLGLTLADFDGNRSDGDLVSATNRACVLIKNEVERLGLINHASLSETKRLKANPVEYDYSEIDFQFLSKCLCTHTSEPQGISFISISNGLREINNSLLHLSAIKLERSGLVEKTIATETNTAEEYDYYSYIITELGIDFLLKNEIRFIQNPENKSPADSFYDTDVPF